MGPWGKRRERILEKQKAGRRSEGLQADSAEQSRDPQEQKAKLDCHACGGKLRFEAGAQSLVCGHCGTVNELEDQGDHRVLIEHDLQAVIGRLSKAHAEQDLKTLSCQSCAASFDLESFEKATTCPYCDSPIVLDSSPKHQLTPDAVLPFWINEQQASQALTHWLKGLWFAPNKLKDLARSDHPLQGVYTPYWTYDSRTFTQYRGARGDIYYVQRPVIRTINGKTVTQMETISKTRWTPVFGRVARDFDDVLVLASKSLPEKITKNLQKWDLKAARPYDKGFLAGFRAESYQLDVEDCLPEAQAKMDRVIQTDIRRDIGGDRQRIDAYQTHHEDQTFKHLLLPVWVSAFRYGDKVYRYVVNGQSAEVQGERPYSWVKISVAVLLVVTIALVFLIAAR